MVRITRILCLLFILTSNGLSFQQDRVLGPPGQEGVGKQTIGTQVSPGIRSRTWYVDWNTPSVNPDGLSWQTAFPLIQQGVDAATDGDTVVVAGGGTYYENVNLGHKAVMVRGARLNGIPAVDAMSSGRAFTMNNGNGSLHQHYGIDGFIITNGFADNGGGISCANTAPMGYPLIQNCIIILNAATKGGGIYCENAEPLIVNNTLYYNSALIGGGGLFCDHAPAVVVNDIFWANAADQIRVFSGADPTVDFCNVQGGWPGHNIDIDPMFVDEAHNDFHLTWESNGPTGDNPGTSPCINRGAAAHAPLLDIEGNPRPQGSLPDMGAHEFTGTHTLDADTYTIHITGDTVHFTVDAGPANAYRWYLILGSMSGTIPGYPLPNDLTLPLNWDLFTDVALIFLNTPIFQNFMGQLNVHGQGQATLQTIDLTPYVPLPSMYFAYTMNNPFNFVSNPVLIEFD